MSKLTENIGEVLVGATEDRCRIILHFENGHHVEIAPWGPDSELVARQWYPLDHKGDEPDNDLLDFGCCPGDSAALLKLRQAIDDAGAWPSDEAREAGDYEAAVAFMAGRLSELMEERDRARAELGELAAAEAKLTEQQAEHKRVIGELERLRENNDRTWRNGGAWRDPDWKPKVGERVEHYDRRRGVITATPSRLLKNSCGNADVLFDGGREQEVWLSSIRPATEETELPHELNAATFCRRCKRFDPSGACAGEPALPVGQGEDRPVMLSELVEALRKLANRVVEVRPSCEFHSEQEHEYAHECDECDLIVRLSEALEEARKVSGQ